MVIALDEDVFGFDPAEIIFPNLICCGAVLIRLNHNKGFVGMHLTPSTSNQEITEGATYARTHLIPAGAPGDPAIHDLVFFVDKDDKKWGDAKVNAVKHILHTGFGVAPTIMAKPPNPGGAATVDLRIHTLTDHSWIGIRPADKGGSTLVTPNNPNVFKIKITTPPSIIVKQVQTLPNNRGGWDPII